MIISASAAAASMDIFVFGLAVLHGYWEYDVYEGELCAKWRKVAFKDILSQGGMDKIADK